MAAKIKKYGVMGGTFDPIHIGHLVVAEEIRKKFNLDKVIFVPTGIPPHKDSSMLTEAKHRYRMTLLATISNPCFEVSSIEVDKDDVSYTIDTIRAFSKIYNDNTQLYFLTGADAVLELPTWRNVEELLKLCKFVAVSRPGFDPEAMEERINKLEKEYDTNILTTSVAALGVSSTDIRNRIRIGRAYKYLLPDSVKYYIEKNNLYK